MRATSITSESASGVGYAMDNSKKPAVEKLKKYLNELATKQDNVYRHQWSVGDLMLIDQRITMHFVFPDYDPKTQVSIR